MRIIGQFGDGAAAEVSLDLGLVVDPDAIVEEGWDVFAEAGGLLASPGVDGNFGLLGDVVFVDHGAVAGDHGHFLRAVRAGVPCTLVGASLRRRQPVVGATAHRRFSEWSKARVWAKLHRLVLDELGARGELDWSGLEPFAQVDLLGGERFLGPADAYGLSGQAAPVGTFVSEPVGR